MVANTVDSRGNAHEFFQDVEGQLGRMEGAGFDREAAMQMASVFPRVLSYDVKSRVEKLEEVFGFDRTAVVEMALLHPQLLSYSVDTNIRPKLSFLQAANIDITGVTSYPRYFSYSLNDRIKPRLDRLRGLGLLPRTVGDVTKWLCLTNSRFSERAVATD